MYPSLFLPFPFFALLPIPIWRVCLHVIRIYQHLGSRHCSVLLVRSKARLATRRLWTHRQVHSPFPATLKCKNFCWLVGKFGFTANLGAQPGLGLALFVQKCECTWFWRATLATILPFLKSTPLMTLKSLCLRPLSSPIGWHRGGAASYFLSDTG